MDTLFEAYKVENNPQQKRGIANNIIKLLSIHGQPRTLPTARACHATSSRIQLSHLSPILPPLSLFLHRLCRGDVHLPVHRQEAAQR